MPDSTIDAKAIRVAVEGWYRKMAAYVEQLGRREIGVEPIEGSLQILRLLLPDDQTCRRDLCYPVNPLRFRALHWLLLQARHRWVGVFGDELNRGCVDGHMNLG